MYRRTFVQTATLAIPATALPSWLHFLKPGAGDMFPMRRNVGYFTERGGTIGWLNHPNGIVVIDSQWKEQAEHLIELIMKGTMKPIDYLINTHHHGDHTSGNIAFKGIARNVLAHENSKINQMNSAKANNNEADQLYPDMTFRDRWQQAVADEMIDIQYWGAGHTNGDSIIHFQQANIVHTGDLVFNRRYPFIDKGAGASIENWINILQTMQSYFDNDTQFIFGHAGTGYNVTGTKDDLAAFADYLTALLEFVQAAIQAGKTKEQIMMATSIPGAPQWTGDGIERSLTAAYTELTEPRQK
jgi:glyoxylase-like metal-dependent hydrolase (beta-lactamase superfamily II)